MTAYGIPDRFTRDWAMRIVASGGAAPNPTHIALVSGLVADIHNAGLWSKFITLNPLIGQNSVAHSKCLVGPDWS